MYQTLKAVFPRLSKHLKFRLKYSAARRIFNFILGVWISRWNTLSRVWYTNSSSSRLWNSRRNPSSTEWVNLPGVRCLMKSLLLLLLLSFSGMPGTSYRVVVKRITHYKHSTFEFFLTTTLKGATIGRWNLRQFYSWWTGHRINWNTTIMTQTTENRKTQIGAWMGRNRLHSGDLTKAESKFFKFTSICMRVSDITFLCFAAVILPKKDFCYANLKFY